MDRQKVPHEHRTLHYRVRMRSGREAKYEPAIVARRGDVLFLIEPCTAVGAAAQFKRFLATHSPEIVFVVVASPRVAAKLPPESYDELYEEKNVPRLVERIRAQDPSGAVLLFPKRR